MIRTYVDRDFPAVVTLINAAAEAYRGIIPSDRWKEPYMPAEELENEITAGIRFKIFEEDGAPRGVIGIQEVKDVTLIRHAYVDPGAQRRGIGAILLTNCSARAKPPLLIGTWAAANWAIQFYEKHGFRTTSSAETDLLLRTYWTIPERQIKASVVLADPSWFEKNRL